MKVKAVVYTNVDGLKEMRKVPEDLPESEYGTGILLGPPDLYPLKTNKTSLRQINNMMVEQGWLTLRDLSGNRAALLRELEALGFSPEKARSLRNAILRIYQLDYYPELRGIKND